MGSPLLINTTFAVAPEVLDDFRHWAREVFIKAVEAHPRCSDPLLLRVTAHDPSDTPTFAIQFRTVSASDGIDWLENVYPGLLAMFFDGRRPEQMPYFTTVMEIL